MHPIYACLLGLLSLLNSLQPAHTARPAPQRASRNGTRHSVGPPTTPPRNVGPCGGWRSLVDDYEWDVDTACRVLVCESRGNANALNGRYVGLFQLDHGPTDAAANIAMAHAWWTRRGWQPWTCR